jgi:hypothetical protein
MCNTTMLGVDEAELYFPSTYTHNFCPLTVAIALTFAFGFETPATQYSRQDSDFSLNTTFQDFPRRSQITNNARSVSDTLLVHVCLRRFPNLN